MREWRKKNEAHYKAYRERYRKESANETVYGRRSGQS